MVEKSTKGASSKYFISYMIKIVVFLLIVGGALYSLTVLGYIGSDNALKLAEKIIELATLFSVVYALTQSSDSLELSKQSLEQHEKSITDQNRELADSRAEWAKQSLAADEMQKIASQTIKFDNLYRAYSEGRKALDEIGRTIPNFAFTLWVNKGSDLQGGRMSDAPEEKSLYIRSKIRTDDDNEYGYYRSLILSNFSFNSDQLYLVSNRDFKKNELNILHVLLSSMSRCIEKLEEFDLGKPLATSLYYSDRSLFELLKIIDNLYYCERIIEDDEKNFPQSDSLHYIKSINRPATDEEKKEGIAPIGLVSSNSFSSVGSKVFE
jgi:hypothetical protein